MGSPCWPRPAVAHPMSRAGVAAKRPKGVVGSHKTIMED